MITILNGKLTIPESERFIGFAGDNLRRKIEFLISRAQEADRIYRIYLTFDDGTVNYFTLPSKVTSLGVVLTWEVLKEHIFKSGCVDVQIKAFNDNGVIWHTNTDKFIVGDSTEFSEQIAKQNTEFLQYEEKLNNLSKELSEICVLTPFIGENGNWYIYDADTCEYTDSGKPSQGVAEDIKLSDGDIDKTSLFSFDMAEKYLSLPVFKRRLTGAVTDAYYNTLTEQGVYKLDDSTGVHQVVVVLCPNSTAHLMQIKFDYNKIEYRGIWCTKDGVYKDEEWEKWITLTQPAVSVQSIGAKIISGEIKSIVLIGDSITDGYGGTDYNGNEKQELSTNTRGYCWANLFKKFVEERYNIPVVNRGMWGTNIKFQKTEAEKFITKNDFVIWLSGTNNRISKTSFEDYQNNILSYVEAIKEKCGGMLFMSNIPSTTANEADHYVTMQQIDEIAFSNVYGKVPYVSLYREFIRYCKVHNISLSDVYYDHVHPNDTGYLIMFKLICDILGLPLDPYKDYSYGGDWWWGNLMLDTGLYNAGKAFDSWTNTIVPVMQMAQYDAQNNTTLFSGKTLRKIKVAGKGFSTGSLTIGTVAVNTLSSSLNVVNKVVVNVGEDGLIDFGEEGYTIPENHTLAMGDVSDTARLSYVSGAKGIVTTKNYMYTADHWLNSTPPAPYIRLVAMFYFA